MRQPDPVEAIASKGQEIRELAHFWEAHSAKEFDRSDPLPPAQVKLHGLRESRQVVDAQDSVGVPVWGGVFADIGKH